MKVRVTGAGFAAVNGIYCRKPFSQVPTGFAATCKKMGWPSEATWKKLANRGCDWFASEQNDSYIYLHVDGQWWIDGPDGAGIYVAEQHQEQGGKDDDTAVPPQQGWKPLVPRVEPLPHVHVLFDD